jgi:hypothetical protein
LWLAQTLWVCGLPQWGLHYSKAGPVVDVSGVVSQQKDEDERV